MRVKERVLCVHKNHFYYGGVETYYFGLMQLLAKHGHTVIPFASKQPQNIPTIYDAFFPKFVDYRSSHSLRERVEGALSALYSHKAKEAIHNLVTESKPDIAHLQHIYHHLSTSILVELKRRHIPVVQTLHDYRFFCPSRQMYIARNQEPCEKCKGRFFHHAITQNCMPDGRAASIFVALEAYFEHVTAAYRMNVDYFVTPSEFLRQKLIESGLPAERVVRIPYFIEVAEHISAPESPASVLYVGRLEPEKGILLFMEAAAQLPTINFVVAGTGAAEAEARRKAERLTNVRFLGHLTADQVRAAISQASVIVVPSIVHDVFPFVILEAFAQGRPVIASRMGGMPELVTPGQTGQLVQPRSVESLVQAIAAIARDLDSAWEMGYAAYQRVRQEYSPEAHYQALTGLYQKAIRAT